MDNKKQFPEELSYILGVITMALGVSFVSASNFGYSMIVAPVYCIYTKIGGALSFGTVEYLLQGFLLVLMCAIIRRFRWQYLLSFLTAVIYGYTFDLMRYLVGLLGIVSLPARIGSFVLGTAFISISVALFMHTYLAPEVYELLVKEIANRFGWEFGRVKLTYDCISCVCSILLSVVLFGFGAFADFSWRGLGEAVVSGYVLEGIGIGTVIAALVNGPLITLCSRWLEGHFRFTKTALSRYL